MMELVLHVGGGVYTGFSGSAAGDFTAHEVCSKIVC
jgi:hypothetical protein